MEFIRAHQLNIMLFMSGMCGILAILSCISKVLSPKRRRILPVPDGAETGTPADGGKEYSIEAVRVRDHVLIRAADGEQVRETILSLPDNTRFAYIAFTGQNCMISGIRISEDETAAGEDCIPRIAEEVSFIKGCPAGDLPNIQIEGWRQVSTPGVPVVGSMKIAFHA